ncbi:MAG: S9 family peptidase [Candidatus Delongbacteria bacterium]|nr:S9 family peptidase [Candidatus Delongbacteria bacterium]MBN2836399.1 S9 family peptidase [Candidatus Delongbacteria bacterium]
MLKAKKIETRNVVHDDILIDNYCWMEDVENNKSEIMEYVDAENQFTKESLKHTEEMQKKLLEELSSRVIKDERIIYEEIDEYLYYYRKADGGKLKNYYRKKGENGAEELVLDLNIVDGGNNYNSIHGLKVSPNHKFIAYLIDKDGSEICQLFIQEISSGIVLDDLKSDAKTEAVLCFEWAADNIILYSSLNTETNLFQFNYRHELYTSSKDDILIIEEENKFLESSLGKSSCKNYIYYVAYTCGSIKSIQYLDLKNPYGDFVMLAPYDKDFEYEVEIGNDLAFIAKSDKYSTNIIIKRLSDSSDEGEIFYTPEKDHSIELSSIKTSKNFFLFLEEYNGQKRLKIINIENRDYYYLELPEEMYTIIIDKVDFKNEIVYVDYSSFKTPWTLINFNLKTKEKVVIKANKIKDYNPDDFISKTTFAKADDGTLIPICLFYKKGTLQNGSNPLYLEAYGNYGYCLPTVSFATERLLLAERGAIYAVAQVRGGGFYGKKWHEGGKRFNKINSFTDLINCAEHLIQEKYTSKDKIIIFGGSAGGTLVLGAANMRPDLFKIVIAEVPVADVLGQMLERSTWTFKEWHYLEWGNPAIKEEYESMKSWCPYSNIKEQIYPHIYVTTGLNDTRVDFFGPLKYIAKLREFKQGDNTLLIDFQDEGHHFSGGKNIALQYAFIFDILGIGN